MKKQARLIEKAIVLIGLTMILSVGSAFAAQDGGYNVTSELWAKAVLKTPSAGDVTLVWREVGTDTTPSGATVVSGYFYADPADFAYGSQYNPELFVKIYIDPSGWCNMAFNHVTVDDVSVYSAHNYSGSANQTGTAKLDSRLVEHTYTGVGSGTAVNPNGSLTGSWSGSWSSGGESGAVYAELTQSGSSVSGTMTVYDTDCGNYYDVAVSGTEQGSGTYSFEANTSCGSDSVSLQFSGMLTGESMTGTYRNYVAGSLYDVGSFSMSR